MQTPLQSMVSALANVLPLDSLLVTVMGGFSGNPSLEVDSVDVKIVSNQKDEHRQ